MTGINDASASAEIVVKRHDGLVRLFARNGDRLALLQTFSEGAWELVVGPTVKALPDAASGEASGDALSPGMGVVEYERMVGRYARPAPSESPNVERAANLLGNRAYFPGGADNKHAVRQIADALDSARAEGIAAERERLRQALVSAYYQGGRTESEAQRCADAAIRAGAKP